MPLTRAVEVEGDVACPESGCRVMSLASGCRVTQCRLSRECKVTSLASGCNVMSPDSRVRGDFASNPSGIFASSRLWLKSSSSRRLKDIGLPCSELFLVLLVFLLLGSERWARHASRTCFESCD